MKFAEKEFPYYWKAIQWPTLILVAWSIAGLIAGLTSFDTYTSIFANQWIGLASLLLLLVAGYLAASDHKATGKQAAWAGALAAILSGVVGVIVFFVLLSSSPLLQWTIDTAVAKSGGAADPAMLQKVLPVTMSIGSVVGVAINGLIGALLGWIGSLIAKKV